MLLWACQGSLTPAWLPIPIPLQRYANPVPTSGLFRHHEQACIRPLSSLTTLLSLLSAADALLSSTATLAPCRYTFTVHGLWPQRRDGTWPEFCDSSSQLDMDEIEDLLPDLEKAWPSWSSDDETFWNHEWTRHGTCAEGVVGHQHAFFKTVLKLHDKLNIQVCMHTWLMPRRRQPWHGMLHVGHLHSACKVKQLLPPARLPQVLWLKSYML